MSDLGPLDESRVEYELKVGFLLDNNQEITKLLRHKSQEFQRVAELYIDMAQSAMDVVAQIQDLSMAAAHITAEILLAERSEPDEEEDDEPIVTA